MGLLPGYFFTNATVPNPDQAHVFFSIYFMMTGLHGIHVAIGMGVFVWLLMRANRGDFHSGYYAPLEISGLYWHLVDVIWIFLFPLLYLIS
jgi:cytochrome c oxidase subunit 3